MDEDTRRLKVAVKGFTAKSAKSAKISLNCLVFDYNTMSEADLDKKGSNSCCMVKFNTVWIYGVIHAEML